MVLYENKMMIIMDIITRSFHIKDLTIDKTFLLLFLVTALKCWGLWLY